MKLFYILAKKKIAEEFSKKTNFKLQKAKIAKFLDGDIYVQLSQKIKGESCIILGGTEKDQLLETSFLAHTLKKEGAKKIIAILPYMAYSRQDRDIKGKSMGIKIVGDILRVSGIDKVITIDLHSKECIKNFSIPLITINPYKYFIKYITINNENEISLVSPDYGAIDNVKNFKNALNKKNNIPIFYIKKKRTDKDIMIIKSHGVVLKDVILVDDILNSGDTIIKAVREVKKRGAKNITIVVTHALFTGNKWKKLWNLGVKKILCTDSVGKRQNDKRIIYIKSSEIINDNFNK